eukprot:1141481-Pelagomonas_calceolata.AAC.1
MGLPMHLQQRHCRHLRQMQPQEQIRHQVQGVRAYSAVSFSAGVDSCCKLALHAVQMRKWRTVHLPICAQSLCAAAGRGPARVRRASDAAAVAPAAALVPPPAPNAAPRAGQASGTRRLCPYLEVFVNADADHAHAASLLCMLCKCESGHDVVRDAAAVTPAAALVPPPAPNAAPGAGQASGPPAKKRGRPGGSKKKPLVAHADAASSSQQLPTPPVLQRQARQKRKPARFQGSTSSSDVDDSHTSSDGSNARAKKSKGRQFNSDKGNEGSSETDSGYEDISEDDDESEADSQGQHTDTLLCHKYMTLAQQKNQGCDA